MGLASTQTLGGILDGLMRNTPDALQFIQTAANDGVRTAIERRDGPWRDYSQAPPERRPDPSHVIEPRPMTNLSENWNTRIVGRLGGAAYDFVVEREWLARPGGRALWGTDTRLLFDSIQTVGEMPDGSAVLDVPCGGGVAL